MSWGGNLTKRIEGVRETEPMCRESMRKLSEEGMVPEDGFEPSRGLAPRDFKSLVSTGSTTQADSSAPQGFMMPT